MTYDAYIDMVANQLFADAFNLEELKIIEECFDKKWEFTVAADLVRAHWMTEEDGEEEDYNMHGDFD
jgi:hypothetical protein